MVQRWWELQEIVEANVGNCVELYGQKEEQKQIIKELTTFLNKAQKHQNASRKL